MQCSAPLQSTPPGETIDASPLLATPPGGKPTVYIAVNDVGTFNGPAVAVDEATCAVDFSSTPQPKPGAGGEWDPLSYGVDATGEPLVLFGTADPDSAVYAIDARTGALVWRYAALNPPPGNYDIGSGVTVSAPGVNGFADGVAYTVTKYGDVYALNLTTGALIWMYDLAGPGGASPPASISTPALVGNSLVLGEGGGAVDLNAVNGTVKWRFSGAPGVLTDSAVAVVGPAGKRIVAYADLAGTFRVLSLNTGALLYQYQTGTFTSSGVSETDGNLIEAGGDGYLYDFAPGGGNPPAPSTVVTTPAPSSSLPNPGGPLTISGTASSSLPIGSVTVALQRNGAEGSWWDSASAAWVPEPYPDPTTLSAPGTTATNWTLSVPTTTAGEGLEVFASAVDTNGVADNSAEQSAPTLARDAFTILPSTSAPVMTLSTSWLAAAGTATVTAQGFGANEKVALTLNGTSVGTATATASGQVKATSFTAPVKDKFGPQTFVATGETTGRSTSAPVYVTNTWSQYRQGPTHLGFDQNDLTFQEHLGLFPANYLVASWTYNAGSAVAGSVDLVDGVAYLASHAGLVAAVDVQTGMQVWSTALTGSPVIDTTPVVVGNLVIVGTEAGTLVALNASTGARVWKTVLTGALESSPSAANGVVYVGSDSGDVFAVTAATGAVLWTATAAGAVTGSPAVDSGAGLVIVGDASGVVRALALATGAPKWTYTTGGPVTASVAIGSGSAFVGSADMNLYALNESTGALQWSYATGSPVTSPVTVDTPDVIVAAGSWSTYLTENSGGVVYKIPIGSPVTGTAAAQAFSVAEAANGTIEGSKPGTGNPRAWLAQASGSLSSSPTVVNGEVFVTGNDGMVQCFTVPGAPPSE